MRHEKNLLAYNVSRTYAKEIESVIDSITGWEDTWMSWIDWLIESIEQKIVDIDMILSRIQHATDYENWTIVDVEDEIKSATKLLTDRIYELEGKTRKKKTPIDK